MRVNADFERRTLVRFGDTDWVASPVQGVERKMLDRIGEEVARATTIVRFAPGSAFSPHTHDGAKSILFWKGHFRTKTEISRLAPTSATRPLPHTHLRPRTEQQFW